MDGAAGAIGGIIGLVVLAFALVLAIAAILMPLVVLSISGNVKKILNEQHKTNELLSKFLSNLGGE